MFAIVMISLLQMPATLDADPAYKQAVALYNDMEYEAALKDFNIQLKRTDFNVHERAQLHLWRALCLSGEGRMHEAELAFDDGLKLDDEAQLPIQTSPKIIELLENKRKKLQQAKAEALQAQQAAELDSKKSTQKKKAPVEPNDDSDPMFIGGVASLGTGLAVGIAGAALHLVAWQTHGQLDNHDQYQDEAAGELEKSNNLLVAAGLSYVLGATLASAGGGLLLVSSGDSE